MNKSNKILTRLVQANIRITNTVLIVIFAVLICLYCIACFNQGISNTADLCREYSEEIRNKLTVATSKSNYIFGNYDIVNGLEKDYENSVFSKYDFADELTMYIDSMGVVDDESTISIYTDNESVFAGKYVFRLETLENTAEIYEKLHSSPDNTYWQLLYEGGADEYIFRFFRKFPAASTALMRIDTVVDAEEYEKHNLVVTYAGESERLTPVIKVREEVNRDFAVIGTLDVNAVISRMLAGSIILAMLCAVLCLVVFIIVKNTTNSVAGEFVKFITLLEKCQVEDSLYNYEETQDYELKIIKDTINRMMENMRGVIEEKHKAEMEKEHLVMQLLQSKIDPHLLYNSLSYINLIAYKKHDLETVEVVNALVDYYRAVLVRNDLSTIALEEALLRKYISIVELSEKTRIGYECHIGDNLYDISIPHLSLQPFVENSVLHGFARQTDCRVKIDICREEDKIHIRIYDNGCGMEQDKLNALNNAEAQSNSEKIHGIANTIKRLRTFFGEGTQVRFCSGLDEGTVVDIILPLAEKADWYAG